MKTNIIQIIATTVIAGFAVGFGSTKITGNYVTGIAVAVGYMAVAALVALAAADYRRSLRAYTA